MPVNKTYLAWAIVVTALTICYYCWMIPAWIHLDDPPKPRASKTGTFSYAGEDVGSREVLPDVAFYIKSPAYLCDSVLKINTSRDASYVVKVVDPHDGEVILARYFPAGVSEEIAVPSGTFEIRYTSGTRWYGNVDMFGLKANYAKAQGVFKFSEGSGYELTLYRVPHGNLRTSKMRREDF